MHEDKATQRSAASPRPAVGPSGAHAFFARVLYTLTGYLALPLVLAHLLWRARAQPAYLAHWAERWAWWCAGCWAWPRGRVKSGDAAPKTNQCTNPGTNQRACAPLIWIHAVSVGETRAAQPLIQALRSRDPGIRILLTAMTPTGRATGQTLWGSTVQQCYLPYDHPGAMRRFLKYWKPSLGLLMETELWPNLIAQAQAQHVPLVLINARLSERSLRRGRRFRALISPALAGLDAVIAQSAADARRLAQLGRSEVPVAGNLKFDVALPTAALERGARWRTHLAGRRLVLCASTREGEEEALLSAWCALAPAHREGLLLAIVPRHPQRFDAVAQAIVRHGWAVRRRSEGAPEKGMEQPHTAAGEVLLGDSMGEMYAWYACADVALIGGTFEPLGGQNLIEACAVGVPVILGPSTFNFSQAARSALEAGAALGVRDAREAIEQAAVLAQDPVRQLAMAQASRRFAAEHGGAVARTLELLEPFLKPLMSPDAHH